MTNNKIIYNFLDDTEIRGVHVKLVLKCLEMVSSYKKSRTNT